MDKEGASPSIIIPKNLNPRPFDEEIWVAWILLDFFQTDIIFVERNNTKTPDFKIKNQYWELKSPKDTSSKTIENLLRNATKQSKNIIISLKRTSMKPDKVISNINSFISKSPSKINRVILITKNKKIIDVIQKR